MPTRLLSVPHSPQEEDVGCLGACAQMILLYLGRSHSQQALNATLGLTSIGTPFRNIERLSQFGLRVLLESGNTATLQNALDQGTPPLVFLKTGDLPYWAADTAHAVVAIGYDDRGIYLNDPMLDSAPQHVNWDDFLLAWNEQDYVYALITG